MPTPQGESALTMNLECWRTIEGFPSYEVSSLGRVKSLPRTYVPTERILVQTNRDSYNEVKLGRGTLRRVHRLVAEAFLPRQEGRDTVDHINRDPTDNRAENLRWVTTSENLMNKGAQKNSKSGHKNISWDGERHLWRLQIQSKTIGRYADLDDALLNREEILSQLKDKDEFSNGDRTRRQ